MKVGGETSGLANNREELLRLTALGLAFSGQLPAVPRQSDRRRGGQHAGGEASQRPGAVRRGDAGGARQRRHRAAQRIVEPRSGFCHQSSAACRSRDADAAARIAGQVETLNGTVVFFRRCRLQRKIISLTKSCCHLQRRPASHRN